MELEHIRGMLLQWEKLGCRQYDSGTTYYGNPGANAGMGWLHRLFAPLPKQDLQLFSNRNPYIMKFSYFKELHGLNGLSLFYEALFLFGIHSGSSQQSHDLPFDIAAENRAEWGKVSGPDTMIIGGANFGYRSIRYVQRTDGTIFPHERDRAIAHHWSSFGEFFISEVARLSRAFDQNGHPILDLETAPYT
jgi:hypothetical protein